MFGSMTAPSVGTVSKAKVPPGKPEILAAPPSQVAVMKNEESSGSTDVTDSIVVVGQAPSVV